MILMNNILINNLKPISYILLFDSKRVIIPLMNQGLLTTYHGKHLARLRKEAGLTQRQLANLLGICQSNIAFWETSDKPPRAELLPQIAKILGVSVEYLLNLEETEKPIKRGPKGKMAKLFEEASQLPKYQQDKIVEFLSLFLQQYQFVNQNKKEESSAA